MSGYKRFITYLFRYEDGLKTEQLGYAKVELRQSTGRIEIHLKNCKKELVEVRPYFFAEEVRVPIGGIPIKNRQADGMFRFEESTLKEMGMLFQDICGIVIPLSDREVIFSQWDDREYSWQELRHLGRFEEMESDQGIVPEQENRSALKTRTGFVQEQRTFGKDIETRKMDAPALEMPNSASEDSADQMSRIGQLKELRPMLYPFEGDIHTWAVQAQLRDLKYLPEDYWNLSNNSFVIRGYFNYGSILIGWLEEKKQWFVGVPGVFCKQEKVIAGMFGFLFFRSKNGKEGVAGEFGYWYQLLDVVS